MASSAPYIPADVIKDICACIEPNSFINIYTLQQLRLVNRAWGRFATSELFQGFKDFSLGNCHEDVATRITTLASSDLRHRVKGLIISRYTIVPRAVQQHWATGKEREHNEILSRLVENLRGQLRRLFELLGPEFRFHTLTIGTPNDLRMYENIYSPNIGLYETSFQNTLGRFAGLLYDTVRLELFCGTPNLVGTMACWELDGLIRQNRPAVGPAQNDEVLETLSADVDTRLVPFLRSLKSIDVFFPLKARNDYKPAYALGALVCRSPELRRLKLRYNKHDRFRHLYSTDETKAYSLEELCLVGCNIEETWLFWHTVDRFPNLTSLHLSGVEVSEEESWGLFFDNLPQMCMNLVSPFFELLSYWNLAEDIEMGSWKRDILDQASGKKYKRPLLTMFISDVEAFEAFRSVIEERREQNGLERDNWLSVFCAHETIVLPLGWSRSEWDERFSN